MHEMFTSPIEIATSTSPLTSFTGKMMMELHDVVHNLAGGHDTEPKWKKYCALVSFLLSRSYICAAKVHSLVLAIFEMVRF